MNMVTHYVVMLLKYHFMRQIIHSNQFSTHYKSDIGLFELSNSRINESFSCCRTTSNSVRFGSIQPIYWKGPNLKNDSFTNRTSLLWARYLIAYRMKADMKHTFSFVYEKKKIYIKRRSTYVFRINVCMESEHARHPRMKVPIVTKDISRASP